MPALPAMPAANSTALRLFTECVEIRVSQVFACAGPNIWARPDIISAQPVLFELILGPNGSGLGPARPVQASSLGSSGRGVRFAVTVSTCLVLCQWNNCMRNP